MTDCALISDGRSPKTMRFCLEVWARCVLVAMSANVPIDIAKYYSNY